MKRFKSIIAAVMALSCVMTVTACDEETGSLPSNSTPSGGNTPPESSTVSSTATMNESDAQEVTKIELNAEN